MKIIFIYTVVLFLDDSIETKYITALSKLVDELPPANKALAEILLLFLSRVGEHSSKNKMTPANLAIVFGQILLKLLNYFKPL